MLMLMTLQREKEERWNKRKEEGPTKEEKRKRIGK
jgi:hypothetical protein